MERNGFAFMLSYKELIDSLDEADQLAMYKAITDYGLYGKTPKFESKVLKQFFLLIKPNIDSSNKRYDASISNGKLGGRPTRNRG
jgi:hypothetical protein